MKKLLFIGVIVVSLLIAGAISSQNTDTIFVNFTQAREQHEYVRVAGFIVKTRPVEYNPEVDSTRFSFYMEDKTGNEQRVIMNQKMPPDFGTAENIVITGSINGSDFVANDMLIKFICRYNQVPSTRKSPPAAAEIYSITERGIDTEWK